MLRTIVPYAASEDQAALSEETIEPVGFTSGGSGAQHRSCLPGPGEPAPFLRPVRWKNRAR